MKVTYMLPYKQTISNNIMFLERRTQRISNKSINKFFFFNKGIYSDFFIQSFSKIQYFLNFTRKTAEDNNKLKKNKKIRINFVNDIQCLCTLIVYQTQTTWTITYLISWYWSLFYRNFLIHLRCIFPRNVYIDYTF